MNPIRAESSSKAWPPKVRRHFQSRGWQITPCRERMRGQRFISAELFDLQHTHAGDNRESGPINILLRRGQKNRKKTT